MKKFILSAILFVIAMPCFAQRDVKTLEGRTPEQIIAEEPRILEESKKHMARILFDDCDILVVDVMGKNYSGAGMEE